MTLLEVSDVSRSEEEEPAVKEVSFTQQQFQRIAIAGATGSGKTTLLKLIAGLVQLTSGTILFEGTIVKGPEERLLPGHPGIAYLSQHFELRNHYRVEEILAMANKLSSDEATLIYEICRIPHLLNRWTHQLSGGEKQRIALASLLVAAPRLLLLDEPYSNLDAIHKNILKKVISDVCESLNITCLLISHDAQDTLSWADEIIVLKNGQLTQQGLPQEIYLQPENEYVAALFGKYNVLNPALAKAFSQFADIEMNAINSFIRPENFTLVNKGDGLEGTIKKVVFMGSFYEAEVLTSGYKVIVNTGRRKVAAGETIYLSLHLD
jgi:ABC-type Fe3+/spermidine/putrescine transport system ATPase subunit